jgi:hypothetical protein
MDTGHAVETNAYLNVCRSTEKNVVGASIGSSSLVLQTCHVADKNLYATLVFLGAGCMHGLRWRSLTFADEPETTTSRFLNAQYNSLVTHV